VGPVPQRGATDTEAAGIFFALSCRACRKGERANYNVVIGETQAEVDDRFARLDDLHSRLIPHRRLEDDLNAYRRSPTVGTPEQVIEALRALYDAGMTYAICTSRRRAPTRVASSCSSAR
jgi:alkanesulfonate monooxygenase SsuD/methylene tetrahydromethanopterin reductase-like flavin-dependent oxidoreductase (luciferase family)